MPTAPQVGRSEAERGENLVGRTRAHGLSVAERAVIRDECKLVRTMHPGQWARPPVQPFDLAADPWEQRDRSAERPGLVQELSALLTEWEYTHPSPGGVDPMRVNAAAGPAGIVAPAAQRALAQGSPPTPRQPAGRRRPELDFALAQGWWA